jgi:hypothetical protein
MNKAPGTLVLLVITWTVFLVAGLGLIWQALMHKSSPTRSKTRRIVNEIKFRFSFASGVALIILFLFGVIWFLTKW